MLDFVYLFVNSARKNSLYKICKKNQERDVYKRQGFGSVHPSHPDALKELERIHALGIKGIKFHPDYQYFFVDEERMFPIYEKCGKLGLIVVFHAGWD